MAKQASKSATRAAGRSAASRPKSPAKGTTKTAATPSSGASGASRPAAKANKPPRAAGPKKSRTAGRAPKTQTAGSGVKRSKLQAAGKAITAGHPASTPTSRKSAPSAAPPQRTARSAGAPDKPRTAAGGPATSRRAQAPKRVSFDRKALAGIKKSLEDQRKDLTDQLEEIEEAAFSPTQAEASSEAGFDEDYADAGTATFEREKDLSIANNINDLVDKIDKALEKIEQGSYGICENCGQPISADRLKALPHVLLCINCKKAEERR